MTSVGTPYHYWDPKTTLRVTGFQCNGLLIRAYSSFPVILERVAALATFFPSARTISPFP
jgi:hypothetical protein